MAIRYGYFNSVNGDRKYSADDISNYFVKLISNGVFATPSNAMQVQENSGMNVQVSAGWAFINCKWLSNDAPYILTIDAADVVLNRIDRIVIRLDASNAARSITIAVKNGQLNSEPTPPTLERVAGGVWELSLAQIAVNAGATAITQADITDERDNTALCGYVTGLIDQIDTTGLFIQYNAAFNTWFDAIKGQLSEDAAGNLQNQINLQNGYISNYAPVELYSWNGSDPQAEGDKITLSAAANQFEKIVVEYSSILQPYLIINNALTPASVYIPETMTDNIGFILKKHGVLTVSTPSGDTIAPTEAATIWAIDKTAPDKIECTMRTDSDTDEIRIVKVLGYGNRNAPPVVTQPYNETQVSDITDSYWEVTP